VIGVDWSGSKPTAAVSYQLKISMQASPEPATSLTTGPAPALKLRLAVDTPPTPPTPTPPAPPSPLAPTNTPSAPGTTNPSPTPPSPGGTPTSTGTSGGTPAPVPSNPPPTPPADAPPPASSGPSTPPAVKNLGDVGPVATAPASNDAGTAVATVSQVSAVAPAVVQTSTTTTAPAAPVSIPSGVVLALSDRALGANADASGGARAFLRETANPPTQTVTVESFGSVLASTTAYLSAAAQPAGPDRETLAAIDAAPWAVSSLPAALATRATGVERELLAAALAGARVVPAYAEALAKLLDSWQFGYQPPTPSPSHPTPAHAPTVEPVPPAVEAALEGAVDAALSAPEVRSVPWYHLSNVARAAIVALTMTLVALRVQSWRAARAAAATGTRTPDLPDCAPSDE